MRNCDTVTDTAHMCKVALRFPWDLGKFMR